MSIKQTAFIVGAVAVVGVIGITLTIAIARGNLPVPEINLYVSPTQTFLDREAKVSWSVKGADKCEASGDWSGERNAERGSERVMAERAEQAYILTCIGPGGSNEKTVTLMAEPMSFTFRAAPIRVAVGETTTLRWDAKGFASCTASAVPKVEGWSGTKSVSGQQALLIQQNRSKTFRLNCRQGGGAVSVQRDVRVIVTDESAYEPELFPDKEQAASYEEYFRADRTAQCSIFSGTVSSISDDGVTFGLVAPNIGRNLKFDQFTVFYRCGVDSNIERPPLNQEVKVSVCEEQQGVSFIDALDVTSGCE